MIRARGFAATSIDDLCATAEVSRGAFFHHFASKEALGVSAARYWSESTGEFFAAAPYHQPDRPLDRVLAYVAFRRTMIEGEIYQFSCLAGTLAQEIYDSSQPIREACNDSILGHAAPLEADFAGAIADCRVTGVSAEGLALHTQAVVQGALVLAKASKNPALARDSFDHLERYLRLLFTPEASPTA